MSRIGRMPVPVPDGVTVELSPGHIRVKGPKGELERTLPKEIDIRQEDGVLVCSRPVESRRVRALHGLVRALVNNMVVGVTQGFTRILLLQGVGYRANVENRMLNIAAGFSHPVAVPLPEGIEVNVEQIGTNPPVARLTITGVDKEQVGQLAADVRSIRPVEPYKLKGFRYSDEIVRKKAGKSAAGAGK
ncbi:MAG: 50S ribosomal protein L6 [Acidobacteriota bacterium]|nr:50S ribosomal protein L6 [Acidobacteriota bacterium]